ncbi:28 kDa ribonucleoprotein, chloroplastic [Dioscorea cayenensis subsp. rotundata]|uniref:28 kDa ribonucleoprotein, chloroplastic n=1 Tax=Dioscorea cayennensis subsp. rotundata TaxID=55577 RepID=A0AB40C5J0_DIOCR|nr:28 kDa ribonucleoprotein, chloroplastic [Dioscorea cayenensis subsp. rotundata]XP_039135041.1 28 kDa ribonucleoprotein, chloroplastic [Dioscorea cayenensis subsp. rotundata]XP_039135042.1 28 kDa ribonucleoprotein, chloroplastic [Dioscorea cayenensis subsp. rotundata]XP_039135043.1 28 kDa ribonucleoprotein, chloroplastic [Dioscorea cayenensis subsp. rotundata]
MAVAAAVTAAPSPKIVLRRRQIPSPSSSFLRFSSITPSSTSISISYTTSLVAPTLTSRSRLRSVAEEEEKVLAGNENKGDGEEEGISEEPKPWVRPCELYVCNLPRSCDVSQLLELFKPHGTVYAVEVSRDPATGFSRGSGFVTMSSIQEAKTAIAALDGSDLSGREMRVQYSADMTSGRRNIEALNTAPKKDIVFETPYKAYIGNLSWSVKPEDLREHFSQFGTVVSTRVLYDRKGGKNRVYGFLSFSSADELKSALEQNGSEFRGRTLLVREVLNRSES